MKKVLLLIMMMVIPIFSTAGVNNTLDGCPIGYKYDRDKCGGWVNAFKGNVCYNESSNSCVPATEVTISCEDGGTYNEGECGKFTPCYHGEIYGEYDNFPDCRPVKQTYGYTRYDLSTTEGIQQCKTDQNCFVCNNSEYNIATDFVPSGLIEKPLDNIGALASATYLKPPMYQCIKTLTYDNKYESPLDNVSVIGGTGSLRNNYLCPDPKKLKQCKEVRAEDVTLERRFLVVNMLDLGVLERGESLQMRWQETIENILERDYVFVALGLHTEGNNTEPYLFWGSPKHKLLGLDIDLLNKIEAELNKVTDNMTEISNKMLEVTGIKPDDAELDKKIEAAIKEAEALESTVNSLETEVNRLAGEVLELEKKYKEAEANKLPTAQQLKEQYLAKKSEYDTKNSEYLAKKAELEPKKELLSLNKQLNKENEKFEKLNEQVNNVLNNKGMISKDKLKATMSNACSKIMPDDKGNYYNYLMQCLVDNGALTSYNKKALGSLVNKDNGTVIEGKYENGWKLTSLELRQRYQIKPETSFWNWGKKLFYVATYGHDEKGVSGNTIKFGNTGFLQYGHSDKHNNYFHRDTHLMAVMEKTVPRLVQECPYGNTYPCFAQDDGKFYCTSSICGNANQDLEYDYDTGENNLGDINNWESATVEADNTCDINVTMGDGKFSTCRLADVQKISGMVSDIMLFIPGYSVYYNMFFKDIIDKVMGDQQLQSNYLISSCCNMDIETKEDNEKIVSGVADFMTGITGVTGGLFELFKLFGWAEDNYVKKLYEQIINFAQDDPCTEDELITGMLSKSTNIRNGISPELDDKIEKGQSSLQYYEKLPQADGGNCVYLGNYCDRYLMQDPTGLIEPMLKITCKSPIPALRINTVQDCKRQRRAFCCYNSIFDKALAKAGRDQMPHKYKWGTQKRYYYKNIFSIESNGKPQFNLDLFEKTKPETINIDPANGVLMKPGNDFCNPDKDNLEIDCSGVQIMDLININLDSVTVQEDMEAYTEVMLQEMMKEDGAITKSQEEMKNTSQELQKLQNKTGEEVIKDLNVDKDMDILNKGN